MKPVLITIAFLTLFSAAKAQTTDTIQHAKTDTAKKWIPVDVEPMPPGGMAAFYQYMLRNLKYPAVAKENNTQGKVFLTFVVEKDGSLSSIRVVRSLTLETDAEAIRFLQNSPKWIPGKAQGKPVRVQYNIPVVFELPEN